MEYNGYFTAVGSRKGPPEMFPLMMDLCEYIVQAKKLKGRSGGADFMDTAAHMGCLKVAPDAIDIWVPEPNFRGMQRMYPENAIVLTEEMRNEAERILDETGVCRYLEKIKSDYTKMLWCRNVWQVLGWDGEPNSEFVSYYAPESDKGVVEGGTRFAVYLARFYGIETYNIGKQCDLDLLRKKLGYDNNQKKRTIAS